MAIGIGVGIGLKKRRKNWLSYWAQRIISVENADATKLLISIGTNFDSASVPDASAFYIPGFTVSSVDVLAGVLTLTLSSPFAYSDNKLITYIKPALSPLKVKGNEVDSFCDQITNNVSESWWLAGQIPAANCIGAYKATGAASLAASRTNLANPGTYTLADGIAPNFSASLGWGFTNSQYLKTGIVPKGDQTWSAIVKYNGVGINNGNALFGVIQATPYARFGILTQYSTPSKLTVFNNGGDSTMATAGEEIMTGGTLAIAGNYGFVNGGKYQPTAISTVAQAIDKEIYIGARNNNGATVDNKLKSGNIEWICFYDIVLTPRQIRTVIDAADIIGNGRTTATPKGKIIPLADMPRTREQHELEECEGKLYTLSGFPGTNGKKVDCYDPATGLWSTKTDIPLGAVPYLQSYILRAVGTKIYCIGGYDEVSFKNTVFEYDTIANTWATKTAMPTAREDFGAAVIGDKIYCFGGLKVTVGSINTMEVYDTTNDTWDETKADLPTERWSGDFGVACNGKIYVIGGSNNYPAGYPYCHPDVDIYMYDPDLDTWTQKTSIPEATQYKDLVAIGNNIYAVGGMRFGWTREEENYSSVIYKYNTLTDTWEKLFSAPYETFGAATCGYNNKIYVCGGGYPSGIGTQTKKLYSIDVT